MRTEFARDRDRIIHSSAFRRLEYKTQVFVNHEGDLFRTRLTHSIEVAQIARSIARALRLNDDLVEAISLAHDLGHTPFGHAGQDALNECMAAYGGFEHNQQSLRIVDRLEERYAEFDGLNLMFETREGILKHSPKADANQFGEVAFRFREGLRPSLEAQICNLADEIAYNNHDVDDGLRSGLLILKELDSVALFSFHADAVRLEYPGMSERRLIHETVRRMIGAQVEDLVNESRHRIAASGIETADDVRHSPKLIGFSQDMKSENAVLKRFLFDHLYRHPRVLSMTERAGKIVSDLFCGFMANPEKLPTQYLEAVDSDPPRTIADYIAGMTDRYAIREHVRLFGVTEVADTTALWTYAGHGY